MKAMCTTMGHLCRICGRGCPNEKFSGKGHKTHVCKDCQSLPKVERERIEIEEELFGMVEQSRISEKNRKRLEVLLEHDDLWIKDVADLILKVSTVAESKRKRWAKIRNEDYELYLRCQAAGLTYHLF